MLYSTLSSKNLYSYTQSAGNHSNFKMSSSETTRETSQTHNFSSFHSLYKKLGFTNSISDIFAVAPKARGASPALLISNGRPS